MNCKTKRCPHATRSQPGALFCDECQERALIALETARRDPANTERLRNEDAMWLRAGLAPPPYPPVTADWWTGPPNVTCPSCAGRYHYGAPVPCSHLCPLCDTWLCWQDTGKTREVIRRVALLCPACGKLLQKKGGPHGPWWGCTYTRKGHKDNCSGRRRWTDCDTVTETTPRLGLAVWEAHVWDDSDDVDHFAALDRATQKRNAGLEAREGRYTRWWEGEGVGG